MFFVVVGKNIRLKQGVFHMGCFTLCFGLQKGLEKKRCVCLGLQKGFEKKEYIILRKNIHFEAQFQEKTDLSLRDSRDAKNRLHTRGFRAEGYAQCRAFVWEGH